MVFPLLPGKVQQNSYLCILDILVQPLLVIAYYTHIDRIILL
jgi:hypothetical protein